MITLEIGNEDLQVQKKQKRKERETALINITNLDLNNLDDMSLKDIKEIIKKIILIIKE